MGRQLVAFAHVRHRDWLDAGQPGSADARRGEVGTEHDENTVGIESDPGAGADEGAWPPCNGNACAGRNGRTAQGDQDLRVGTLAAHISFIYTSKCLNP